MSLIRDLYRHERTKYIFGFGGPKKPGKGRNPRHTLLKWALPLSVAVSFVKLLIPVVTWITRNDRVQGRAVILDYPSLDFRSRFRAALGVQVAFIAVSLLQAWNFLIVWHRKDNTVRRSVLVALGDVLLIAIGAADVPLVNSMLAIAPSARDIQAAFPDLSIDDERADTLNKGLVRTFPNVSRGLIATACADAAIHVCAIIFWHWLLPPVWRFPRHFKPIIYGKSKKRDSEIPGDDGGLELPEQQPEGGFYGHTSLAAHFQEQERLRSRAGSRRSVEDSAQEGVRSSSKEQPVSAPSEKRPPKSSNGRGPRFAPPVQYWAFGTTVFNWLMRPLSVLALISSIIEIITYAVNLSYGLQCNWPCHLTFTWCILATLLLAAVIVLVRFRIPLDYKLVGMLRIDVALMLSEFPFSILGLFAHVNRLVRFIGGEERKEEDNSAIGGFRMVTSIFWLCGTLVGVFLLPLTLWTNYRSRKKSVEKMQ